MFRAGEANRGSRRGRTRIASRKPGLGVECAIRGCGSPLGLPGLGRRHASQRPPVPPVRSPMPPAIRWENERSNDRGREVEVSEEDSLRMRAAAMDKFLSGDAEGAVNIAKVHDEVTGNAGKPDDSGSGKQK